MSEQDFFFDEEVDAKPAPRKASAPKGTSEPTSGSFFAQDISVSIAALMAVIALLLGIIVGVLIPSGGTTSGVSTGAPASSSEAAPQLTPDQLDSGELPAGHPDLSGMTSDTATESTPATGN
ncbi:MAG: hypothetical protein CVT66_09860 [Actinobacteria bacterium HGW-Actinobacteria-6]|nr:MAG: hypothetical protein CVT66_09860 [Actinobacteria bacterium HGW-Actinobacteria-6]